MHRRRALSARVEGLRWLLVVGAAAACGGKVSADFEATPSSLDGATPDGTLSATQTSSSAATGGSTGVSSSSSSEDGHLASEGPADASGGQADGTAASDGSPSVDATSPGDDATATDAAASDDPQEADGVGDMGLPSTAPCLTGGHVLWVQGDPGNVLFSGTQTYAAGTSWLVEAEAYYATYDGAYVVVGLPGGGGWYFSFNTWGLKQPMQTGVRYDASDTGSGSELVRYLRTCMTQTGSFEVEDFSAEGGEGGIGTLLSITASFSVTCDNSPGAVRGCFHY
jgi:hypothetical protein